MNGIVQPSSSNLTVASICDFEIIRFVIKCFEKTERTFSLQTPPFQVEFSLPQL